MILIGQYDSSFVRRVAIAMRLYDIPFEHRPWSVFSDAEKIAAYNPLMRVPTLVLDDGDVLTDSPSIIDYLDGQVPAERALHPREEPARRRSLRISALSSGLADKAVSLFYERQLHENASALWEERCLRQIRGTLAVLEAERAAGTARYWFGDRIGHADIAVAASIRHMREPHPDLADLGSFPALSDHCERMEAMPVFRDISQPFIAPA